jgi:hypothetical protein
MRDRKQITQRTKRLADLARYQCSIPATGRERQPDTVPPVRRVADVLRQARKLPVGPNRNGLTLAPLGVRASE